MPRVAAVQAGSIAFDRKATIDKLESLRAEAAAGGPNSLSSRKRLSVATPRVGESTPFADDEAVADWVEHAVAAASRRRTVSVFLDGLVDHDRSYYPRHGLIDRRYSPRPALYRLIEASRKADPT
jgi:hypothetical protein